MRSMASQPVNRCWNYRRTRIGAGRILAEPRRAADRLEALEVRGQGQHTTVTELETGSAREAATQCPQWRILA